MIIIRTIAHGRAELFDLWVRHTKSLDGVYPVAAVSCNDTREVCRKHGIDYVMMANRPLARKANASMKLAEEWNPEAVITCGSDDFISQGYIDYCRSKLNEFNLIHSTDIYYYDTQTGDCAYSRGYENHRKGEALAVGRCYRADLLNLMGWITLPGGTDGSIDRHTQRYIDQYSDIISEHKFRQKDIDGFIVDVKGKENITQFKWRPNYERIGEERFKELPIWLEITSIKQR